MNDVERIRRRDSAHTHSAERPCETAVLLDALREAEERAERKWRYYEQLYQPRIAEAEERAQKAEAVLRRIEPVQMGTVAMLRRKGFVFATPLHKPDADRTEAERWEKLAFSLYSTICEIDSWVSQALGEEA